MSDTRKTIERGTVLRDTTFTEGLRYYIFLSELLEKAICLKLLQRSDASWDLSPETMEMLDLMDKKKYVTSGHIDIPLPGKS